MATMEQKGRATSTVAERERVLRLVKEGFFPQPSRTMMSFSPRWSNRRPIHPP